MGTKRTCERCGREFISHGSLLCSGCEKARAAQANAKARREFRKERRDAAKHKDQPRPGNG
jgi:uncharacterized Zn finger protein (UPF0148 family)